MNESLFKDSFENKLIPNLQWKVLIAMNNVKYHSRFIEKTPSIIMKKDEMIVFMSKNDTEIPNPISTKLVLLQKIRKKCI